MVQTDKPDLPERLRRNRTLRVAAWLAVVLTITFLVISRTDFYQVYHHRSALHALQRGMWAPQPKGWRAYLSMDALFWLMNRNTTMEQRMSLAQHHIQELIDLGYLEERRFYFAPPPNGTGTMAALQPFLSSRNFGTEYSFSFSETNMVVVAPTAEMEKWVQIVESYNAAAATNGTKLK
jgi:hypothetical protein